MISYVPINDELSLVHQEIKNKKMVTKRGPVNHIWLYDRSGSMYHTLPELTKQMILMSRHLPKDDTLTLGWFSSEGDFNFILKGFLITDSSDYKLLETAIKANDDTRGCTCFSEIIADTKNVIGELSGISKSFSLHLFTDGYPVVSNYSKEITNIFSAIDDIKGSINTAMIVGYGSYYNKELMNQMAEKLGAILVHSSAISEYGNSVAKLVKLTENQEPKEEVTSPVSDVLAVFLVTEQGVIINSIDADGKLYINPQSGKNTSVFYLTKEKPNKKSWDKIEIETIDFANKDDVLANALYASALVMTQQVKTDIALEIVGRIGDKNVVDAINNAFTIDEYGNVEEELNKCIGDITNRFSKGRDKNYLPAEDSFCVFDLLNILMADDDSAFFPNHKDFEYERIGVPSKTAEGYPKFEADKMSKSPFTDLVWHSSRLNLNVRTTIKGTVELNSVEAVKPITHGLPDVYPAYMFRNYTFVKDGRVNVKKFYVTSSEKTYKTLKNAGIVVDDTFVVDGIYGLDSSKLPAINRKIASGKTSATELCKMIYDEQVLVAKLKSLNFFNKNECGDVSDATALTAEQIKFLSANGINAEKGGLYSPPVEKGEATDKYVAKSFEIKIAGMSSLPTVKKVIEKIEKNKARTPVELLIEEGINIYSTEYTKGTLVDDLVKKAWFKVNIMALKEQLKEVRTNIQATKFAVILGKKWFDEFSSRNDTKLTVDGKDFSFVLGEDVVEI